MDVATDDDESNAGVYQVAINACGTCHLIGATTWLALTISIQLCYELDCLPHSSLPHRRQAAPLQ
eukprot:15476585-Alexandrium_andersonii.AAC.1